MRRLHGVLAATVLMLGAALHAQTVPAPVVLEGFENPQALRVPPGAALVSGADAVTEGAKALSLPGGAAISLDVRGAALPQNGFLRVDTFSAQPSSARLAVRFANGPTLRAVVAPGKDTLAVPLSALTPGDRGGWPRQAGLLELRNVGTTPVVLDHVRLVEPPPAPEGTLLLDVGADKQVLWPGFQGPEAMGQLLTWGGANRVETHTLAALDALTGDFAGPRLTNKATDTLTVQVIQGPAVAWLWVTHFGGRFSAPAEYGLAVNGKPLLHKALHPSMVFTAEGVLAGRDEPWTNAWYEKVLVPNTVSRLETPLKAGANVLDLVNVQLAGAVLAPAARQHEARAFVTALEEDLARYRRQFVLAVGQRPVNTLAGPEDGKPAILFFQPPGPSWFDRTYAPQEEHRGAGVSLKVVAGTSATTALVAVPTADMNMLSLRVEALRNAAGGLFAGTNIRTFALEAVPVADDAVVAWQPFLPEGAFKAAKAHQVCWFLLRATVPETAPPGTYTGTIRASAGAVTAGLPVALEIVRVSHPPAPALFGAWSNRLADDAYQGLADLLGEPQQTAISRSLQADLAKAGFNASMIGGLGIDQDLRVGAGGVNNTVAKGLFVPGPGRGVVNIEFPLHLLSQRAQAGTTRFNDALRTLTEQAAAAAQKAWKDNYSVYRGIADLEGGFDNELKTLATMRQANGRCGAGAWGRMLLALTPEKRKAFFDPLELLICLPDAPGLLKAFDDFEKPNPARTSAVYIYRPSVYAAGFYSWGIGADGWFVSDVVAGTPPYHAFFFDTRNLLVPLAGGQFQPTLSLLLVQQGMEDYLLARRCEAMAQALRAAGGDPSRLETVLSKIRLACDPKPPGIRPPTPWSSALDETQFQQWRDELITAAGELSAAPK